MTTKPFFNSLLVAPGTQPAGVMFQKYFLKYRQVLVAAGFSLRPFIRELRKVKRATTF